MMTLTDLHARRVVGYIAARSGVERNVRRRAGERVGVIPGMGTIMAKKKTKKKSTKKKGTKKKGAKKARRTVMYSSKGKKLYAVRSASGQFKDIQQYSRAHAMDIARESADGN